MRRGSVDPLSTLDSTNVDLSWHRVASDDYTKELYDVYYERGDIVITDGIVAQAETKRNIERVFHHRLQTQGAGSSGEQQRSLSPETGHFRKKTTGGGGGAADGSGGGNSALSYTSGERSGGMTSERGPVQQRPIQRPKGAAHRKTWSRITVEKTEESGQYTASSPKMRRVFVATRQNHDSHPMSNDGVSNWRELRLSSKAWSTFVTQHFPRGKFLYIYMKLDD